MAISEKDIILLTILCGQMTAIDYGTTQLKVEVNKKGLYKNPEIQRPREPFKMGRS